MTDGKWLTPRQLERLSLVDRERYISQKLEELLETDNEDEEPSIIDEGGENNNIIPEDSDAEELQLPEYDPVDETDSDEEFEEDAVESFQTTFTARDGTIWLNQPPQNRKVLSHNILRFCNTGPAQKTVGLSFIDTFKLLMSEEMCDIIIRETNRKAIQCYESEHEKNPAKSLRIWTPMTTSEFDAYLGILLLAGVTHSNFVHTSDLWKTNSHPLYRAAMGLQRFWAISRFIRFDNGNTRQQRKVTDKAAAISDIFLMLNRNLRDSYVAGSNVTVDEQLYPYRGGTGFTQYIPSKPAKYGIKVWWVCDAITSYPINGQIYTGLSPSGERETNQGERVVKDLCCNIFRGSGRNIVCDNFFTSYNLASSLMSDYKLSILGTVNKRRKFVPNEFSNPKGRPTESSLFGFNNNISMCSYIPKRNKSVVLLSTSHYSTEIEGPKQKPVMILDYNRYKGGVDNMDKCLAEYSTKRRTNRWPLAFFYNIIDVAAFAAFVICMENNPHLKKSTSCRRLFLQQLSEQLALPQIQTRSQNAQVIRNFSSRSGIECILGHSVMIGVENLPVHLHEERDSSGRKKHKGNCYLCTKKRPTRKSCKECKKPVCAQHSVDVTNCDRCVT